MANEYFDRFFVLKTQKVLVVGRRGTIGNRDCSRRSRFTAGAVFVQLGTTLYTFLYTSAVHISEPQKKRPALNVVIQRKLIRMRTQPHRIHLLGTFVLDVGGEQVFGEDVALQQELVVALQGLQGFIEGAGH